jgi:hypothetical protein
MNFSFWALDFRDGRVVARKVVTLYPTSGMFEWDQSLLEAAQR